MVSVRFAFLYVSRAVCLPPSALQRVFGLALGAMIGIQLGSWLGVALPTIFSGSGQGLYESVLASELLIPFTKLVEWWGYPAFLKWLPELPHHHAHKYGWLC